jgi:RNA polymerase sigma-70 factor, ECF subfamily
MSLNHVGPGSTGSIGIEHLDGLYGYALTLTRNGAEAEDLVHETYASAMQAIEKISGINNMKSWLFSILRAVWLNPSRRRPNRTEIGVGEVIVNGIVEQSEDGYCLYVDKTETDRVRTAIQQLPVDLREIILLREYEDLSYQEIAGVLGCPVGTVMPLLSRARAKLRALLAGMFDGIQPA